MLRRRLVSCPLFSPAACRIDPSIVWWLSRHFFTGRGRYHSSWQTRSLLHLFISPWRPLCIHFLLFCYSSSSVSGGLIFFVGRVAGRESTHLDGWNDTKRRQPREWRRKMGLGWKPLVAGKSFTGTLMPFFILAIYFTTPSDHPLSFVSRVSFFFFPPLLYPPSPDHFKAEHVLSWLFISLYGRLI